MPRIKIESVMAGETEIVVGSDPEMSDMSNPQGLLYGKVLQIVAVTDVGRRFILARSFELSEHEPVGRLSTRIQEAGDIDPEHWVETFEVYGSPSWQVADDARRHAWESDPATRGTVRDT